jgi:predicted metal-binding protein
MIYQIQPDQLVLDRSVRGLCVKPYPGHPKGCPNFNHKAGCPPQAGWWADVYDVSAGAVAIVNEFDIGLHVAAMRKIHPRWSERQLECCLYWQPKARAQLKETIADFRRRCPGYDVNTCPEAMGVNVTETMKRLGVLLEWPPKQIVRQVAIAAIPIKRTDTIPAGLF